MQPSTRQLVWSVLGLALAVGCGSTDPSGKTKELRVEQLSEAQRVDYERAVAARDALAAALKGRLMEAIGAGGPASAIAVCSEAAPQIAREVAAQTGVAIGRTSFKLRNRKNAPPEWAEPLVERRVEQTTCVPAGAGLNVLLPIRVETACLLCHGDNQTVTSEVAAAIASRYSGDRARGFEEGDLRGWFWVEVADAGGPG